MLEPLISFLLVKYRPFQSLSHFSQNAQIPMGDALILDKRTREGVHIMSIATSGVLSVEEND